MLSAEHALLILRLTICSPVGTALDENDTTNKVFHHSEIFLKESAVPIQCSYSLVPARVMLYSLCICLIILLAFLLDGSSSITFSKL